MKLRKISASYVFTLIGNPLKNGIVVVDEHGIIQDVIDTNGELQEIEGLEYYSGIICPGFVNVHCHLELSHLKGKIEPGIGLPAFLKQISVFRNDKEEIQLKAMRYAERLMIMNGIIAVGDISNGTLSLEIKEKRKIFYHTFIECFGFLPERAQRAMEYAEFATYLYDSAKLPCSITPHAPYSVSEPLWDLIIRKAVDKNFILSVHHQESKEEDLMFISKTGGLIDHYTNNLNLDSSFWEPTGTTSTQKIIEKVPVESQLLLIHNTYLDDSNLALLEKNRSKDNSFLVTCPNSNLYIESQLPNYQKLKNSGFPICIGTDSLASNPTLSILDEIKIIQENNAEIQLEELLRWACLNGAKAIGVNDWAGSFEKGKKPGINLISNLEIKPMRLTQHSKVTLLQR